MSYYRNVKNWLLEKYPQHRNAIEQRLLKMGSILERHCMKRQQGGAVTKAPACTKADLRSLVDGLYFDATSSKEYQDAALLCIMRYAFGRASDLAFIQKCSLSVSSGNVLFLRLIRAKTSEEQGLSLFPDKTSFITCPLHAIDMALVMQTCPVTSVLDLQHLANDKSPDDSAVVETIPLTKALLQCGDDTPSASSTSGPASQRRSAAPLKMQAYVNRVLKVARSRQEKAGVSAGLSSHSFRRGGAHHANASSSLSPQWNFDRGSWNMTATNKAFAYVFNTTNEDRKVSKMLSDWKCDDNPTIPSLAGFDSATTSRIRGLMRLLFASSLELSDSNLTMDTQVAELLVASLIRHFPEINERYPMSPYASRMRQCLFSLQVAMPELLAWSVDLTQQGCESPSSESTSFTQEIQLINHQNAVIAQLIEANKTQTDRIAELQKRVGSGGTGRQYAREDHKMAIIADSQALPAKGKFRSASKTASATWFEWYTKTPRLWEVCDDRQYKSQSKQIVALMKLFLPHGFTFDPSDDLYADRVVQAGNTAQTNMNAFLHARNIKRKHGSGLLKQLRVLLRDGAPKELISGFRARLAVGQIRDSAPEETNDMFLVA